MIPAPVLRNRNVGVLGLARSGLAAARSLRAGGAQLFCWDDAPSRRASAVAEGFNIEEPPAHGDLAALIASPGVPLSHPLIVSAIERGVEVIGDIELLWRVLPEPRYIGVTGTNGKSTTTALIGHVLRAAGEQEVQTGGNLGTPALELNPTVPGGTLVLELSSYQLDLTVEATFDAAVLLNITPDHLERHGSMSSYIAAKRQIFRPGRLKTAVVGTDDPESREIRDKLRCRQGIQVVPVSSKKRMTEGISVIDAVLYEKGEFISDLSDADALPGKHNWQNAAAAYAVGRARGLSPEVLAMALRSFSGLPHRMEKVGCVDGVPVINDSKATNAEAAAHALACYEHIYWIAGGRPKSDGIAGLKDFFPKIAHAFLIGEAEDRFAKTLEGMLPVTRCGTLDRAVDAAIEAARGTPCEGSVVLFSPACASFDQFSNFEERGNAFRALVPDPKNIDSKGTSFCVP